MAGIYIHIPFCKKACHYCNFHFSTSTALQNEFAEALIKEIELRNTYLNEPVQTIYFGGGTPSILPPGLLKSVMDKLDKSFLFDPEVEITLEANPDDITDEKLTAWKSLGINRLSLGIQSFFEEDLRWMNRAHNAEQALNCIKLAQAYGFYNLTIDLIYGTPTLSNSNWEQNIQYALDLNIPHLSCYALTVEPKTVLENLILKKKLDNIDTEKQALHFELLMKLTAGAGYEHYEISNFAKPGHRSKHNSSYWQGKPYLGLGPSAHSFDGESRQWNVANNSLYIKSLSKGVVPFEKEILSTTDRLNEYIMTSLRTMEGLSLEIVDKTFGQENRRELLASADKYLHNQTLIVNNDYLQLTSKGRFLADGIAADLFFTSPS